MARERTDGGMSSSGRYAMPSAADEPVGSLASTQALVDEKVPTKWPAGQVAGRTSVRWRTTRYKV